MDEVSPDINIAELVGTNDNPTATPQEMFTKELELLAKAVDDLEFLKTASLKGLDSTATEAITAVRTAIDDLKSQLSTASDEAKTQVDTAISQAEVKLNELNTAKTQALAGINTAKQTAVDSIQEATTVANDSLNANADKIKQDLLALPTVDGFKDEVVEEIKKESGSLGGGMGVDGMIWVINQEALLLKNKLKNYN